MVNAVCLSAPLIGVPILSLVLSIIFNKKYMKKSKMQKASKSLKSNINENGLSSVVDKLLKQDKRLWTEEGQLIENKLIEFVQKDDENIIKLLLSNSLAKDAFFQKVSSVLIFKKDDFISFKTMSEFLDGSYTAYSKHIGLANNFSSIKNTSDVVLDFPYKDCILEGGQDKGSEGREEVFYNKILAREDINRLEDEKALTGWIRYTEKGKTQITSFDHKKDNLILRGNNLLALYSLLPKYRGQVKLIYIDPPYNTGTDDFKYNDKFNHSSWLVFMKNRLEVAKKLLKDDGVIFVQCDDNEQAYLKVLMDEIFTGTFLNTISVKAKVSAGASGGGEDKRLKKNIEYIHCYYKNSFVVFNDVYKETEIVSYIEQMKNDDKSFKYTQLLISTGNKKHFKTIKDGSGEDITIYKHSDVLIKTVAQIMKEEKLSLKEVYKKYFKEIFTTTNAQSSIRQRVWDATGEKNEFYSIEYTPKSGRNKAKLTTQYYTGNKKVLLIWFSDTALIDKNGDVIKKEKYGTFWDGIDYNNLNKEGDNIFPAGKKPEQLIQRVIEMSTEKDDLVLDYHLGSGTTCAVAHKMGRRYIGIEQLDYGEDDSVVRLNNVIRGDESGISKSANWKGGGSFVHAELIEWNEKYIQEIEKSKTTKDLIKIYEKINNDAFLVYTFDASKWDNKKFEALSFDDQKKILLELLNMNHLYVNYKDIEDSTFKVSKEDIKLNKNFYE
jgi:adenine-specific DNA-methyltransferase